VRFTLQTLFTLRAIVGGGIWLSAFIPIASADEGTSAGEQGAGFESAAAAAIGLGDPGQLTSLSVQTGRETDGRVVLRGKESRQQLLVTGHYATGQRRDLTRQVTYDVVPQGMIQVDSTGWVTPIGGGQVEIKVTHATGVESSISVEVGDWDDIPQVNFANQIVPIFTKLMCNSGGCHGKSGGQNGFRLSLLGFEPLEDHEHLLMESQGRRLSIALPEHSLLLLKATGRVPHGGGAPIEVGDHSYRLIRRWIAQGAPLGDANVARVASIEVLPKNRVMPRNANQQLVVVAHYEDGTTEDVTAMAQYDPNVAEMAEISSTGRVKIMDQTGDVAVMVRYQSRVAVFRATIPLGAPVDQLPHSRNFVDQLVFKKFKLLGLPPSPVCDDATFLRRASVDITGRLPAVDEVQSFLADGSPDKRDRWIDTLLASGGYADLFANKWSAILRNKRIDTRSRRGSFAFHHWIRAALHENLPYDELVRGIVTATGEVGRNPPVVWYREVNEVHEQVEDTAQLFLGLRIQCARCHHHPFEKWSRHDYYSFAAFFSRVGRKPGTQPLEERIFHRRGTATAVNPKNGQTVKPAGLGDEPLELAPETDPRHALVDWMTGPENHFFAHALVNRYWKHFFGRGLVNPEDDLRATNPATNPELLDHLSRHFISTGFDLKDLIRTICQSTTYQLSSLPNEFNQQDSQNFSRFYPRRLSAEVLLDAIDQVAGTTTSLAGLPPGTRAVQLPDSGSKLYFLRVFGRPNAATACECERSNNANLAQSLHLINSPQIHDKITSDSGRAALLTADQKRTNEMKIHELLLSALNRYPTADEIARLTAYLEKKAAENEGNARRGFEDVVWALVNTKEFLFNH